MHGRHTGHPRVEGHEEVEGFGASDLSDDQVFGAHTQGFAYEVAQRDLARALGGRRASLHGDVIPVRQAQLEDLLAGDDAPRTRQLPGESAQQRRLARLCAARDEDGQPHAHGGGQEVAHRRGHHVDGHQIVQGAGALDVLADVDAPGLAGHRRDDNVEALSPGQHGIHEGAGQVEAATRMVQHPLHECAHVLVGEDEARQLGDAASGHEHARRRVDPDFLHAGVVHEDLEGAQAADVVHEVRFDLLALGGQHVGGVGVDGAVDEGAHGPRVSRGIDAARGQPLSHPRCERACHGFHP